MAASANNGKHENMILAALALAAASPISGPAPKPLILAFGDSLTAGHNLASGLGFAPQLQATLRRHGIGASVVDGGVSGDTTTGGKARLGWTLAGLKRTPDLVILELGANDMLRTIDPAITHANLDAIMTELDRRHIPVLVAGMKAAPNLDPAYRTKFDPTSRRSTAPPAMISSLTESPPCPPCSRPTASTRPSPESNAS